ncbi:MAG TPA: adenine methyltransferase [Gammaproteobacteria bacterium]|nr:adenine methyltransferase [Gammaproteobacteria bacterium]
MDSLQAKSERTQRAGIGGHHSASMKTDDWLTPPEIIRALEPFDLDPCASDNMPWVTGRRQYTRADDGLKQRWVGRIWLNPPYGKQAAVWLERLAAHSKGTALIFARTETAMFFDHVWPHASALLFIKGRLHFHYPNGTRAPANAGGPSVLIAYGSYDAYRLETSGIAGQFIRNLAGSIDKTG